MKKRIILLFLQIIFFQEMFSQTLEYRVIKDSYYHVGFKDYLIKEDEVITWKDDYFFINYDSYKNYLKFYLTASYQNQNIMIDAQNLIMNNKISIFEGNLYHFIPCYYLDLLKSSNANKLFSLQPEWQHFKNNNVYEEGGNFYSAFRPEKIVINNLSCLLSYRNGYMIKNITIVDGYYLLTLYRCPVDAFGDKKNFEYERPYSNIYMKHKDENEINVYLKFDGDYVDIWINSLEEFASKYFVAPMNSTQEEIHKYISTGKYNINNVYWPRHADGTSDFDKEIKPPMVELVKNTEVKEDKILKSVSISKERISKSTKSAVSASSTTQAPSTNVTVNKTMLVTENLKLRFGEATTTSVLTVMSAGTKVKILELGKAENIDGIDSNWVKVEVQKGAKDRDGKEIKTGTVGWCYGGYLK